MLSVWVNVPGFSCARRAKRDPRQVQPELGGVAIASTRRSSWAGATSACAEEPLTAISVRYVNACA